MELSISLPADLAAIADPSAREAAPLLDSRGTGARAAAAVLPFELCLDLLSGSTLGGEVLPADGKDLPLPAAESGVAIAALPPAMLLASSPAVPGEAPVPVAPPTVASELTEALLATALPPPAARAAAQPLPMATLLERHSPAPATRVAPLAAELESLVAPQPAAPEAVRPELAPAIEPAPQSPTERRWLETFLASDARSRAPQPEPRAAAEPRTLSPAATAAAASNAPSPPAADWLLRAAATAPAPQGRMQSLDEFRLAAPIAPVADAPSVGSGDWLPAPGTTGGTPSTATPAASAPSAPVDMRTPSWQEAFASRVEWLVETNAGEARIKLNPPELGAVDVKISLVDDKTYVQLTAATAAARDELTQSLPRLRELLTVSGLEVGGASVHNGRDQQPASHGYGTAAGEPRSASAFADGGGGEPEIFLPRRSLGSIDVFA